jgi:hypothetical protein
MSTKSDSGISRRRLLISTSMAATVGLLAPRALFAQYDGLVQTARKTAAAATITVQKLPRQRERPDVRWRKYRRASRSRR